MLNIIHRALHDFFYPVNADLFVRLVTASYAVFAVARLIPVHRKQRAGYRPNPRRTAAMAAGGVFLAGAVAACTLVLPVHAHAPSPAVTSSSAASGPELGVFEPGEWE